MSEEIIIINAINLVWKFIGVISVFWMTAGFCMLEAGIVRKENVPDILFKNIINITISFLVWWLLGYSFSFGKSDTEGFIGGSTSFGYVGNDIYESLDDLLNWCFQAQFASCSLTIISGGLAERCCNVGYIIICIFFQVIIYPVISHWCWSNDGWLYLGAGNDSQQHEYLHYYDYAGSGVIHITGGITSLICCKLLGERSYPREKHNIVFVILGTLILWMGWFGFNTCSGGLLDDENASVIAGRVIINTILCPSSAALMTLLLTCYDHKKKIFEFDVVEICNGILVGLVSITAPCAYVKIWAAVVIGIISSLFYVLGMYILEKTGIDDVVGAFPVHACGGIWGILATGLFHTECGWFYSKNTFMAWQVYGVLAIVGWTSLLTFLITWSLNNAKLLRDLSSDAGVFDPDPMNKEKVEDLLGRLRKVGKRLSNIKVKSSE